MNERSTCLICHGPLPCDDHAGFTLAAPGPLPLPAYHPLTQLRQEQAARADDGRRCMICGDPAPCSLHVFYLRPPRHSPIAEGDVPDMRTNNLREWRRRAEEAEASLAAMQAGKAPPWLDQRPLVARQAAQITKYENDIAAYRAVIASMKLAKAEEQAQPLPRDTSDEAVARRLDDVCHDLMSGRTTPQQRRGLRSATDRADRVTPATDAALGRIITGGIGG